MAIQAQTISTVAGAGVSGYSGDDGAATSAMLYFPDSVALDAAGNLYIADTHNNRVRKVTPAGTISTVAGNGAQGYSGDGGAASNAMLYLPDSVALDAAGNLYIADTNNQRIRKVTPGGTISTVAGNGSFGYSGDGGSATSAKLYFPEGVTADLAGNLLIADTGNHRIRKVTPAGIISTVAGTGASGYSGDGGAATYAKLYFPEGVATDFAGNLLIADTDNHRIRKVTSAGVINTVAGNGAQGFGGDGGAATAAMLHSPYGVTADAEGNLYIADTGNQRVRKVATGGIIGTVAGTGAAGYNGDGGTAANAMLYYPFGVTIAADGSLYIADTQNHRVRKVAKAPACGTSIRFCAIPEPMPIDLDLGQLRQPVIPGQGP